MVFSLHSETDLNLIKFISLFLTIFHCDYNYIVGETGSVSAPDYYFTKPVTRQHSLDATASQSGVSSHYPSRFSRRTRGMKADTDSNNSGKSQENGSEEARPLRPEERVVVRRIRIRSTKNRAKLSPWCRPKKVVKRIVKIHFDKDGNEIWPDWYKKLMEKMKKKTPGKSEKEDQTNSEDSEKENVEEEAKNDETNNEQSDNNEEKSPTFKTRSCKSTDNSQENQDYKLRSPTRKADIENCESLQVAISRTRSRSRSPRIPAVRDATSEPDEDGYIHVNGDVSIRGTPRKDSPVKVHKNNHERFYNCLLQV